MIQKWKNKLSTPVGHALLSKRVDDAYIAAFPRSGSTWLRTILVNALDPCAKSNPDVFNARIPAVSIRNSRNINALESPRLIMTHSLYRVSINKAIYLVRDGRDAFISSFHYHVTRNRGKLNIDDYFQRYQNRYYGHTWENHVESWFAKENSVRSLMMKFEDLKGDPLSNMIKAAEFLNLDISENRLRQAIDESSLDKAKKIEQQRQGKIIDNNASFYRRGQSQQWQEAQYSEVIERFSQTANHALRIAGYLD